jgi:hypothetical protein
MLKQLQEELQAELSAREDNDGGANGDLMSAYANSIAEIRSRTKSNFSNIFKPRGDPDLRDKDPGMASEADDL